MYANYNSRKFEKDNEERFPPVYLPAFFNGQFYVITQEDVRRTIDTRYLTINRINDRGELESLATDDVGLNMLAHAADFQHNLPTASVTELKDRIIHLLGKYLEFQLNLCSKATPIATTNTNGLSLMPVVSKYLLPHPFVSIPHVLSGSNNGKQQLHFDFHCCCCHSHQVKENHNSLACEGKSIENPNLNSNNNNDNSNLMDTSP